MNIKRAIFYLLLSLYSSFLSAEMGLSNHTTEIFFASQHYSNKSYRLREFQTGSYRHNHHHHYAVMSVDDFRKIFSGAIDKEILSNLELFAFENFRAYARSLGSYNKQILSLEAKIKNDKNFKKKTAYIPGFECTFGLRGEKLGFHDFITQQAQIVRVQQNKKLQQKTLRIDDVQRLNKLDRQWSSRKEFARNSIRLHDRLVALHAARTTRGTELDSQLQKELRQSCNVMKELERTFIYNHHVRVLSPVVHHYAAQAARESCPIVAFELSDFCHVVTQVLSHGMHTLYDATCAVGKGISKSAQTFTSVEHWKDMATGMLHLGLLFADAVGQEEDFHYAAALAKFSDKPDIMVQFSQNYCLHTQIQKDLINRCAQETYQKIKSMSWQELLESGAEIGTTMILDTLALHALSGFTKTTSNAFVQRLQSVVENEALFAKGYAVEVAGFGKLVVEDGAEVASFAIKSIDRVVTDDKAIVRIVKNEIEQVKNIKQLIPDSSVIGEIFFDDLRSIRSNIWQSSKGIIYGYDRKFGNTLNHVLSHMTPNPNKVNHTVFSIPKEQVVKLIDEAWVLRGDPLVADLRAYLIDMKKIIGTEGETAIRIVVKEPGTTEIITAYPVKI